jgi:ferrochelatase
MSKQGVLLVNLGSPDSPSVPDVRRYLREFLMDGRVLDAPWPIRFGVVHFAILPSRPKESAEAYHKIWTPEGSPLVVTSRQVRAALAARITVPVELAMRYQNPSIPDALSRLAGQGVERLLVIPLFPHFAMSSFETAVERVREAVSRHNLGMHVEVQPPYFDHPEYLTALVASAQPYLDRGFDHLLFSFHGIPERHLRKSDPTKRHCLQAPNCCEAASPAHATCYRAQCFRTMAGFVRLANIPKARYSVAFQSRLGRDPWLKPYTDHELERFGKAGVKRLLVICPAFVSDCLETLEEIGMRGRETFQQAGGGDYEQIPCLNNHPLWIATLEGMVKRFVASPPAVAQSVPA